MNHHMNATFPYEGENKYTKYDLDITKFTKFPCTD